MNSKSVLERTAFCFDLDGTITKSELLPCIAAELGIMDEMATLTRATMDGHIKFEPSFRLRCLLIGQVDPQMIRKTIATVPLNENLLSFIADHREDSFIITGNLNIWIQPILDRCLCRSFSSVGVYENSKLQIKSIINKARTLMLIRDMGYKSVVAVGDGANDEGMLNLADVGIAYGGIHPAAQTAIYASKYIVHDPGTLCNLLRTL